MYNDDRKSAFIDSYTKSDNTKLKLQQLFTQLSVYEEELDKDLCEQSAQELQPFINGITGLRQRSSVTSVVYLREYVKWCRKNGYKTSNGISEVKFDCLERVRSQMVASPLHLKTVMDKTSPDSKNGFDTPDKGTVDITYRVFLWMAFAGLQDRDAVLVTNSDVDFQSMCIRFDGKQYDIYRESIEDFRQACTLTSFLYEHPSYTCYRDRAPGDIIMRGFRSSSVDVLTVRPYINKHFDSRSVGKISYKSVYLSGIFYRAYEKERAGLSVSFQGLARERIERKAKTGSGYVTSKTSTLNSIANGLEKDYMTDYARWKCAFAL